MEPTTAMMIAMAAPSVISMLQPRPSMPGYRSAPPPPDRSRYANQILDTAFNPNSERYRMASEAAMENINRILARQGLLGSSIGAQIQSMAMSDLANKFMNDELQRMSSGFGAVGAYDLDRYRIAQGGLDAAYNSSMDRYNASNQNRSANIQGMQNLVNTGIGYYQNQQMMNQMDADRTATRDMYLARYGTPGPTPYYSGANPNPTGY